MSSDVQLDRIADKLEELVDAQNRTADMMEAMVYMYAEENETEVQFETYTGKDHWTAIPPWEDR